MGFEHSRPIAPVPSTRMQRPIAGGRATDERTGCDVFDDEDREFHVVINDEEQHSIWPTDRDIPAGWHAVGPKGPRAQCLAYIDQAWSDLRPLSLRRQMEADQVG
jgi:MbtH protein